MTPENKQKFMKDIAAAQSGSPVALSQFNTDFGYLLQNDMVKGFQGYDAARAAFQAQQYTNPAIKTFFMTQVVPNLDKLPDPGVGAQAPNKGQQNRKDYNPPGARPDLSSKAPQAGSTLTSPQAGARAPEHKKDKKHGKAA